MNDQRRQFLRLDRINGKLDSMTKQFIAKTGSTDIDSSVLNELERVTKNVIVIC